MTARPPSLVRAASMRSSQASSASGLNLSKAITADSMSCSTNSSHLHGENPAGSQFYPYYDKNAAEGSAKSARWTGLFPGPADAPRQFPDGIGVGPGKYLAGGPL